MNDPMFVLQPYLDSDERLLWSGRPKQGIVFRVTDILVIPFSLFWAGFVFFWEYSAIHITQKAFTPFSLIFPLFGLPFILVGLYITVGRFFVESKIREKTYYGLTNRRVLILSGLFSQTFKSIELSNLTETSLTESAGGFGTIVFGNNPFAGFMNQSQTFPGPQRNRVPCFELISEAHEVHRLVLDSQKTAKQQG